MKKAYYIWIVLLSLFLMPSTAVACGKAVNSKEMSAHTSTKKSCCGTKSCSKNQKQKACNGKCGHSICSNSSVSLSFLPPATFENSLQFFDFYTEKQKFSSSVTIPLDGFSTIWLIPKIG
jgi:hypothetical protein